MDLTDIIDSLALLDEEDYDEEINDWEQQKITIEKQYNIYNKDKLPEPTKLLISTVSSNCIIVPEKTKSIINIELLTKYLKEKPFKGLMYLKDTANISRKNQRNGNGNKIFYNQITLGLNHYYNPDNNINYINCIKIKLFQDGVIGIAGMKDIYSNDGKKIVNLIIDYIKNLPEKVFNVDYSLLGIYNFKNSLMNSNFSFTTPFCIDRNKLYNLLINDGYFVVYKNDSYPAVKLRYYYNESYDNNNGICKCNIKCEGKGDGVKNGDCKCITIPIFQTSSVLIFGKCEPKHIYYAYDFITKYLVDNYDNIRQISYKTKLPKKSKCTLELKPEEFDNIQCFKKYVTNTF